MAKFTDKMKALADSRVLPGDLKGKDKKTLDEAIDCIKAGEYPWESYGMKERLFELLCEETRMKCTFSTFRKYVIERLHE